MKEMAALTAKGVTKTFWSPQKFVALKDIDFTVAEGEFVSIVGKSGSGKSTLLYVLSTMDTDYQGHLEIGETAVSGKSQNELAVLRNKNLGFIFQFHYLLPDFSCLRNVMIPALRLGSLSRNEIEHNAYEKLKMLGVGEIALKPAAKISGGQQQRVAIARALINNPSIIMGDEPTGNLDSKNTSIVFEILQHLSRSEHKTIIVVTHDLDFAAKSDRIVEMTDGQITPSN